MKKETKKQQRRRYALHNQIRAFGLKVHARQRTVIIPCVRADSLLSSRYKDVAKELMALGYNFQTAIT